VEVKDVEPFAGGDSRHESHEGVEVFRGPARVQVPGDWGRTYQGMQVDPRRARSQVERGRPCAEVDVMAALGHTQGKLRAHARAAAQGGVT
jgi:hypothetical protein